MKDNTGKIPPQAVEVEKQVIGCLMTYPDSFITVQPIIQINTFYKLEHQIIFEIIKDLHQDNKSIDLLTVFNYAKKNGNSDLLPIQFLAEVLKSPCMPSSIEQYSFILKEKHIARKQIELGYELIKRGYDETIDALKTNDFINDKAYELGSMMSFSKDITNHEILTEIKEDIERATHMNGLTGVDVGFNELNSVTGGLQPSELIVLAGRPGMGKTSMALCMMLNSVKTGKRGLLFSLEMSQKQLTKRLVTIESELQAELLKKGDLNDQEWSRFHVAAQSLNDDNIKIVDDIYLLDGIINKCKIEKLKNGVAFVVVDYLQLIQGNEKLSREQQVSTISRKLKLLAKDLNVPVIALSQLSRSVETRGGDKRPMLSDLRDSGAVEQDADIVAFMYRAQYYGLLEDSEGNSTAGMADMMIEKNRSGKLANIPLRFNGACTKFTGVEPEYMPNNFTPNEEF